MDTPTEAVKPTGFARIPVLDLSLAEAREVIEDSSWFDKTRMPVLFHFPQVTVDGYWDLKVKDHTEMVAYLVDRGLFDGKP